MSKYIDAEKLITEIERFSSTEYSDNTFGDSVANGALYYVIEEIIPSLQQEQPEVELEKEVHNYLKTYHLHIKDGGRVVFDNDDSPNLMCDIRDIARHFYELGLNAKEE